MLRRLPKTHSTTRTARGVPSISIPIPDDLDDAIWGPESEAHAALPLGFANEDISSHVLLAACQAGEQANEDQVTTTADQSTDNDIRIRGVFTCSLLACLRAIYDSDGHLLNPLTYARLVDSLIGLTYGRLMDSLDDHYGVEMGQTPLCQGKHRNRLLFTTTESSEEAMSFAMRREGSNVFVYAGEVNGIVTDTQFIMHDPKGATKLLPDGCRLLADKVEPHRCTVVLADHSTNVAWESFTRDARAIVHIWNSKKMKLLLRVQSIVPTAPTAGYTCVNDGEYHDGSIIAEDDHHWTISLYDPLTSTYAPSSVSLCSDLVQPTQVAEDIARWLFHLYRFHKPGQNQNLLPRVDLCRVKQHPRSPMYTATSQIVPLDTVQAARIKCNAFSTYKVCGDVKGALIYDVSPKANCQNYYGLMFYNDSDMDLFLYVFYFDPINFSIQVELLPSSYFQATLTHHVDCQSGYLPCGTEAPLARCNHDSKTPEPGMLGVGPYALPSSIAHWQEENCADEAAMFIKVFVSTSYVNMEGIEQMGLSAKDHVPHVRSAVLEGVKQPRMPDTWASSVYVLTTRRIHIEVGLQLEVGGSRKT